MLQQMTLRSFLKETALVFPAWMMLALLTVPFAGEWAGLATFPAAIALSLYARYETGGLEGLGGKRPHPQQRSLFHQDEGPTR